MIKNFNGQRIIISPDRPKLQLAPGDYITSEYRAEIDAWLLASFGTYNLLEDGVSIYMELTNTILMNPRTYVLVKAMLKVENDFGLLQGGIEC